MKKGLAHEADPGTGDLRPTERDVQVIHCCHCLKRCQITVQLHITFAGHVELPSTVILSDHVQPSSFEKISRVSHVIQPERISFFRLAVPAYHRPHDFDV